MPTYDYVCDDCGYSFEMFQGMLEKKLKQCPECAGSVRRLIGTGAGIVFKGSGFYETDYRSDDYRKKAKSDKPDGAEPSATKADGKSEKTAGAGDASTTPPKAEAPKRSKKPDA